MPCCAVQDEARLKHERAIHDGQKQFVCSVVGCGKTFTYNAGLKRHCEQQHGAAGKATTATSKTVCWLCTFMLCASVLKLLFSVPLRVFAIGAHLIGHRGVLCILSCGLHSLPPPRSPSICCWVPFRLRSNSSSCAKSHRGRLRRHRPWHLRTYPSSRDLRILTLLPLRQCATCTSTPVRQTSCQHLLR